MDRKYLVNLGVAGVALLLSACISGTKEQETISPKVMPTPEVPSATPRIGDKPLVVIVSSPRADVTYTTDKEVPFDGSQSFDPDLVSLRQQRKIRTLSFKWQSSLDGPLKSQASFSRYLSPGQHFITLEVRDIRGVVVSETVSIMVAKTNMPPVAKITSPINWREESFASPANSAGRFGVGQTVYFDGSQSSDPDGDPLSFTWEAKGLGVLAITPTFSRSFTFDEFEKGAGWVTFTVADDKGLTNSFSIILNIVEPRTYGVEWYNKRGAHLTLAPGETTEVEITFKNLGAKVWVKDGPNPVYLSYHWYYWQGIQVVWDGLRTPLPRDVHPGETITVKGKVKAPEIRSNNLELRWDLVEEGITWFSLSGIEHMGGPWGGTYSMAVTVGQTYGYGP